MCENDAVETRAHDVPVGAQLVEERLCIQEDMIVDVALDMIKERDGGNTTVKGE